MDVFKCTHCGKLFANKNSMYRHAKHNCKVVKEIIDAGITHDIAVIKIKENDRKLSDNQCCHCNKIFSSKISVYRHMKNNCKVVKQSEKDKDNIYAELKHLREVNEKMMEKMKIMELRIETVAEKPGNITNDETVIVQSEATFDGMAIGCPVNNRAVNSGSVNNDLANNGSINNGVMNNDFVNNDFVNNDFVNNSPINNNPMDNGYVNNDLMNNDSANNDPENNDSENNGSENNGYMINSSINNGTVNNSSINNGTVNNGTVNNGTVNNGTVNNSTVNITFSFGKEDISKIDPSEMINVFKNGFNSTIELTDAIHFNPKYPEYHNVYIPSMKDKYAMIHKDGKWELVNKQELINKIYDNKKDYIEDNKASFYASLTKSQKNALERWISTDDDDTKIKDVKERMKLLLYNKKHIPMNTKKNNNHNDKQPC